MFECLGRGAINIQLVSTSEIKIAVIVDKKDAERAAQLMHAQFGLARLMSATSATGALG
jgi:aspartate kinase